MLIGRITGIPVRLHWSFLLLMVGFSVSAMWSGGLAELMTTGALQGALFGSVLLHELGHALAARSYGVNTRDITLYPFGGVAALERMPKKPIEEMVVALAGPAVNLGLLLVFGAAWMLTGWWMLAAMALVNLLMGVFNLIPAFPMDGGRVLRAALASQMGWVPASRLAIRIGNGFAWVFVGIGIVSGWWSLALVGGFLLFALRYEQRRLAWEMFMGDAPKAHGYNRPRRYVARVLRRP